MKKIELISLKLTNFKGIQSLEIDVDGVNASVFGDNATGKTTVFDGFLWLLFDKDSNNNSKFAIQTLTTAGKKVHNLEHTVEAILLVDGVETKLKKLYKEKWTKPRGKAHKEFGGYTTEHFVDDVPVAKKDYVKKIEEIVQEDVFKLLTSPSYFNEQVKWQERRKILLEVCGDISDAEVIASDAALAKLNDVLSGKSIEDMKKIIASRKKHINDELEKIPVRIDEITKMIPEVNADTSSLKTEIAELEKQIDELKGQRYNILNGNAIKEAENDLKDLQRQLQDHEREFKSDSVLEVQKLQVRIEELKGNSQIIQAEIRTNNVEKDSIERDIQSFNERVASNEQTMQQLRDEYVQVQATQFEHNEGCTECPTCKQALPADQLEAARNEALAQFNEQKASHLQTINTRGTGLKAETEQLKAQITELNEKLATVLAQSDQLNAKLEAAEKELTKFIDKLNQAQTAVPDVTTSEKYQEILGAINTKQAVISEMKSNAAEVINGIDEEIAAIEEQRKEVNARLNQFDYAVQQQKRINELEAEQKKLAAEYEELEGNLFLVEEFTRKKVAMLENRINSKFKYARFKLFEEQVNGGLNEVCETLYEGVPYGSGLNNAAKINVGLDIINTLSTHYGILAPIFVDNAEAVTKFIDVQSQMISLVVSEKDKQLRVEVDPIELKEAI